MKKMIKLAAFATLSALALTACGEKSTTEEPKPSAVSIEAVKADLESLTFKITPVEADAAYYLVQLKGAAAPTGEAIAKSGKPVDATASAEYTEESLSPATDYDIYAVAHNQLGYSEVKSVSMSTGVPVPSVTLTAGEVTSSSISFTLASTNAGKVAYSYVKKGETVPTAETILSSGVSAEANAETLLTVENLDPETTYTVVAAASDIKEANPVLSEVIELTTDKKVVLAPAVGDFYFSDGTWSASLEEGKTPIAVVFYVGVASDKGDAVENYKLKDGVTPMSEVKAYAIALHNAKNSDGTKDRAAFSWIDSWSSAEGTSTDKTDFLGYKNSVEMIAWAKANKGGFSESSDNYPALYYASVNYEAQYPAPETSSGWFLPSAGQLKYLWTNLLDSGVAVNIDEIIAKAGDKLYDAGNKLWSSTIEKKDEAYYVYGIYLDSDEWGKDGYIDTWFRSDTYKVRSAIVF